jgi:hypothetical protein
LLISLKSAETIAEVIKQVKGSTSHFINQNELIPDKFAWQTGYAGFSVSESIIEKVYVYIQHQKLHHQKKTFQQEFDEFIKLYGLDS